jgi:hypothetical protein
MSAIFLEGFDTYGPAGVGTNSSATPPLMTLLEANWTGTVFPTGSIFTPTIVAPLSATGNALSLSIVVASGSAYNAYMHKALPANYGRIVGGYRFNVSSLTNSNMGFGFVLRNGSAEQVSVTMNGSANNFSIRTGNLAGTVIATSAATASVNTTHYLEFDITIGAAGAYQLWLDGVSILSGTGNTRGDGANNYANSFGLGSMGNAGSPTCTFAVDDLYLFETSTAPNNAVLNTNPRIVTQFATSDAQAQFTPSATILGQDYIATSATSSPGSNSLFLRRFTPQVNMTINSVSCIPNGTNSAVNFKAVVYADNAGSPNGQPLLASASTATTGAAAYTVLTSALSTPYAMTGGTPYWIGFITDNGISLAETDANLAGVSANITYSSGAPATCPNVTTGKGSWVIYGNCTSPAANYVCSNVPQQVGAASYAGSSTVGSEDLYNFPALPTTPTAIYVVGLSAVLSNSDSGARTAALHMKSAGTDQTGLGSPTFAPAAAGFNTFTAFFPVDPATSSAWTAAGLNAATAGPAVAS